MVEPYHSTRVNLVNAAAGAMVLISNNWLYKYLSDEEKPNYSIKQYFKSYIPLSSLKRLSVYCFFAEYLGANYHIPSVLNHQNENTIYVAGEFTALFQAGDAIVRFNGGGFFYAKIKADGTVTGKKYNINGGGFAATIGDYVNWPGTLEGTVDESTGCWIR